jgi:hypothetical protein
VRDQHIGLVILGAAERVLSFPGLSNHDKIGFLTEQIADDRPKHFRHRAKMDSDRVHAGPAAL